MLSISCTSTINASNAEHIKLSGISGTLQKIHQNSKRQELVSKKQYVNADLLNVRESPNIECDVITQLKLNTELTAYFINNNWALIFIDGQPGYVHRNYLSDNKIDYKEYDTPYIKFKSWMPYTAITSVDSKQYELQQIAYTGDYGIRMIDGRYCVALGSYFGADIGQYFDIVLENGVIIPCVMSDLKADIHTDSSNIVTVANGCMSEFIVDYYALDKNAKKDGDMSSCLKSWNSHIVKIIVYEKRTI